MKHGFSPIRLLAEVALLVFVCALLVMFIIPYLAPSLAKGDLFPYVVALLVVLISAPWLYWRCMAAERRGAQYVRRHTELGKHLSRMSGGGFRAGVAMTAAAHIVGLLLTTAGAVWLYQREVSTETDLFERRVNRLEIEVRRRFDVPLAGLKGLRATFLASSKVTREEFREYMDSRDLASEFPGIRGFGVIERVLRKDIDQFRAAQKADGAPDFEVKTSGSADDLYVIKYVEPLSTNKQAFGFDVGQEPVRRAAIELSLRSRQPTLTGPITLVQD